MPRRYVATACLSVAVSLLVFGAHAGAQRNGTKAGGGKVNTTARQKRPIQLGTSGGNALDLANGFCCSGTLGSLVQRGGTRFILSNTHVLAGDSVPGGNGRVTLVGDPVNQPGLIDARCENRPADYVGQVWEWSELRQNADVDAALATVDDGDVDPTGAILGIGQISAAPAAAFVGQAVKKTGRTTGLTHSSVVVLNANVTITYETECAGTEFTIRYTKQVIVDNRGGFIAAGDSGSLLVEDVATNPRAVGLIYAGSSLAAIANPIQDVLDHFGVSMVGAGVTQQGGTGAEGKEAGAKAQGLTRAMQVQERNSARLLNVPGAIGHGVGLGNTPVIKILVDEITPAAKAAAPSEIDGVPVVLEAVGQLRALPACARKRAT